MAKLIAKSTSVNLIVIILEEYIISIKAAERLDVSGHKCPIPVLRLRRAMEKMSVGECLELKATDPMTMIDIPNFCRETEQKLVHTTETDKHIIFVIEKC
ncbi:MAG: sulfurtransferase TusA family protein [Emcibacteraceae bacterium]